jgi:hypothetical protein
MNTSRHWYRNWSAEHERYFYWDSITSQSVWEAPTNGELVIDYLTNLPVSGNSVAAVAGSTGLTSATTVRPVQNTAHLASSSSSTSQLHSTQYQNPTSSSAQSYNGSSFLQHVSKIDESKRREIEENDRRLAEKLQAEMDREYQETVETLPSPAEALARMREEKKKKQNPKPKAEIQGTDTLEDAFAGIHVKVVKNKTKPSSGKPSILSGGASPNLSK